MRRHNGHFTTPLGSAAFAQQCARLGLVDASVITVAENLDVTTVATLNRRDFAVVRPRHVAALEFIPGTVLEERGGVLPRCGEAEKPPGLQSGERSLANLRATARAISSAGGHAIRDAP